MAKKIYEYLRGVRALMNSAVGLTEVVHNNDVKGLRAIALVCVHAGVGVGVGVFVRTCVGACGTFPHKVQPPQRVVCLLKWLRPITALHTTTVQPPKPPPPPPFFFVYMCLYHCTD